MPAYSPAQLDSAALRSKFGEPLNRETFHLPEGFDLVVDYGPGQQVCKLEVPALMPANENPANTSTMNRRMYGFLADPIPDSVRGKELRRMLEAMGALSVEFVEYEHVTISESHDANQPLHGTITVRFKNADCQVPAGQ